MTLTLRHKYLLTACAATAALAIALWGCSKNPLGPIEPLGNAPFIHGTSVSPDSISIELISPVNGYYLITANVAVRVTDPDSIGDLDHVQCALFAPGGLSPRVTVPLQRVAGQPDTSSILFSGQIRDTVTREETGAYLVAITAFDRSGLSSNVLMVPLRIAKQNSPPYFGFPLGHGSFAGGDSVLMTFSVPVSDSDGVADIRQVEVRVTNALDTSPHIMLDDGVPADGDAAAGDGIYSAKFWAVLPNAQTDTVTTEFVATDRHGAAGPPFVHTFRRPRANSPPTFVSIDVPSVIQRPSSGELLIHFAATVADPDGLGDIASVYFINETSSSPTRQDMYDDGNLVAHGDTTAHDGVFSLIVQIAATNTPGDKSFHFFVVDFAGATTEEVRIITVE